MTKLISKIVLIAAIASLALAGSMTSSFAAKKKAKRAACVPWTWCASSCNQYGWCGLNVCGVDRKWHATLGACWGPYCPPRCRR